MLQTLVVVFILQRTGFGYQHPISEEIPLFDWQQLQSEAASVKCPSPNWSCKARQPNCHCDNECTNFGDCCIDKAIETINQKSMSLFNSMKCLPTSSGRHLYMITSCPKNYANLEIKAKCQLKSSHYSYHMDLPVEGKAVYSNIFCALCNGEEIRQLAAFKGGISCNNLDLISACGLSIKEHVLQPQNYVSGTLS